MPRWDEQGFTLTQYKILHLLLTVGPMPAKEVANELGMGITNTRKAIRKLHEAKKVYVRDWPYIGTQRAQLWAYRTSNQVDEPKPPPLTREEYSRNYRDRNKGKIALKRSTRVGNPFAGLILGV